MCVKQISGYEHFAESPECGDIIAATIKDDLGDFRDDDLVDKEVYKTALSECIRCP